MVRTAWVLIPVALAATTLASSGRADPACDTLLHTNAPFQIRQTVVANLPGKQDLSAPAVTEVHRAPDGAFVSIMSGPMGLIRNTGRYGTIIKAHTKSLLHSETRFEHELAKPLTGGFGEKRDFAYEGKLSTDGGKTYQKTFTRAKFLGERDETVGPCTFHLLDYKVTRDIEQNGVVSPKLEYDVAYAPELLYHLRVVTTVFATGARVETRATDISTDFKPLSDPGD